MDISDVLFDRIINVKFRTYTTVTDLVASKFDETTLTEETEERNELQEYSIICPDYGPKPDISLTLMSVEGHFTFNVQLTLINFTSTVDITTFREMEITAGYANPSLSAPLTVTYICPIFQCYIETPNPAGRTVFIGIAARNFQHLLSPNTVHLIFNNATVTLQELCETIFDEVGMEVEFDWPDELLNASLVFNKQEYYGKSGYSLINWLLTQLQALSRGDTPLINDVIGDKKSRYITIAWVDNTCRLGLSGYTRNKDALTKIDVNKITSAEISGGLLTVTAPWNPRVQPGCLIQMDSKYFRGRMLPNSARDYILPETGDYTVILMNVEFSTTGTNQMTLKAVAAPDTTLNNGDVKEDEDEEQPGTQSRNESLNKVGTEEGDEEDEAIQKIEFGTSATSTAIFSYDWSGGGSEKYLVQEGDVLSRLARDWWPDLHYYKENVDKLKGSIIPTVGGEQGYTGRYFWPTIFFATQYAMKDDDSFYVNPSNPDDLRVGKYLIKPNWTDPDQIQDGAALFTAAADCYDAMTAAGVSWYQDMGSQDFRQIAAFMEAE